MYQWVFIIVENALSWHGCSNVDLVVTVWRGSRFVFCGLWPRYPSLLSIAMVTGFPMTKNRYCSRSFGPHLWSARQTVPSDQQGSKWTGLIQGQSWRMAPSTDKYSLL